MSELIRSICRRVVIPLVAGKRYIVNYGTRGVYYDGVVLQVPDGCSFPPKAAVGSPELRELGYDPNIYLNARLWKEL